MYRDTSLCLLLVSVFVAVSITMIDSKEFSTTWNCIPITECKALNDYMMKRPSFDSMNLIRTSACGFEGMVEKVWCPNIIEITDDTTEFRSKNNNSTHQQLVSNFGVDSNEIPKTDKLDAKEEKSDLFPKNCGMVIEDKVFGGYATELDEYPWVALLQYESRRTKKLHNGCGGILITKRYVLTAAHCVTIAKPVRVILGEYDTRNETDCVTLAMGFRECADKPIALSIEEIHQHPEWLVKGRRPFYHDIALIRLSEDVRFTDFVSPICLPSKNFTPPPQNLVVAGWGRTETRGETYVKQQVSLPLVDSKKCSVAVKKDIGEGQICAGGVEGKDACVGDSGGPLMAFDLERAGWVAAGVVSLSVKGCGIGGIPGIYTFVPHYLEWIHSVVKP